MASESGKAGSSNSGSGPIHRLVRTLSGRTNSPPAGQPVSPILSSGAIPPSISEEDGTPTPGLHPDDSTSAEPKSKQKVFFTTVIDRFKNLGLSLGLPPPKSGENAAIESHVGAHPTPPSSATTDGPFDPTDVHLQAGTEMRDDPAEPTYLARKIQALIDSLPLPGNPRPPTPPRPPARDSTGRPIPPPDATPIKDSKLIAMLSSATVMNGGHLGDRDRRVSVWSVLESLGPQPHDDGGGEDDGPPGEGGGDGDEDSVFSDTSGIMMYSPLMPTMESLVEIADSEVFMPTEESGSSEEAQKFAGWMGMWPFSVWNPQSTVTVPAHEIPVPGSPPVPTSPLPVSPPSSPRRGNLRLQRQRVWVPSTTKLSVQAMWWGYRLYLPPPVLDILNDKQLEASKRAALITTALTWFFSNIPLNSLPPSVRPALLLMQTLIPYIGYIGTFISWSWGTIKSYDTGHGVILTSTWLLPVALIPSTWEERNFPPASPPEQASTPLPPATNPSLPPGSPSPTSPAPAYSPPASAPNSPAASTPTSPLPDSGSTPTPPLLIQLPRLSPAQSYSSPVVQELTPPPSAASPLPQFPSQLLEASEPLPLWVQPPPPPSPPTIPLPETESNDIYVPPSPRFGLVGLGRSKSKKQSKSRDKVKDGQKEGEGRTGRARLKSIVTSPFLGPKSSG
ncbi:hypothetical protein H0H81_012609 [Sphagnurus paluster]|uniref:Uncharacterized protein n=1 Tax=Sphagnurus paluster TaxID=117069 RepID=A0A9P7FTG6_9AGAR|nr:hypothetical protein H0H81_012609 [Sphagnurus paluster]